MAEHKKNIKQENLKSTFEKIEKLHPHKLLMYLFIFGSSMIFLFMMLAYTVSETDIKSYDMPKAFVISALVMLVSGFSVSKIVPAFKQENISGLRNALAAALILGVVFTCCQYIGWQRLKADGIFLDGKSEAIYLYVISGLHLALYIIAMSYLSIILLEASKAAKDPVKALIKVTNPYEKVKLQMLNSFWQYLTILWLALFFYFLYSF